MNILTPRLVRRTRNWDDIYITINTILSLLLYLSLILIEVAHVTTIQYID
jgi:hypothetical protein